MDSGNGLVFLSPTPLRFNNNRSPQVYSQGNDNSSHPINYLVLKRWQPWCHHVWFWSDLIKSWKRKILKRRKILRPCSELIFTKNLKLVSDSLCISKSKTLLGIRNIWPSNLSKIFPKMKIWKRKTTRNCRWRRYITEESNQDNG